MNVVGATAVWLIILLGGQPAELRIGPYTSLKACVNDALVQTRIVSEYARVADSWCEWTQELPRHDH